MIINVAGSSGAGKTTLVRHLIAKSRYMLTILDEKYGEVGRIVHLGEYSIFIAGRYDEGLDSGGCDCVKDIKFWYDTVWEYAQRHSVVYEGLFVMNHTRGLELTNKCTREDIDFHVILLDISLEDCLKGINERRARRGQEAFSRATENIENNVIRARNFTHKVKQLGATVHRFTDRTAAAQKLMELFDGRTQYSGH